jgi:hypothetical protein
MSVLAANYVGQDLSWQFAAGDPHDRQDRSWPTRKRFDLRMKGDSQTQ